jgi:serine/threonine protein kinase
MAELKPGYIIELANGESIKILKEIGRGGQGIVYLSEYQGRHYAFKWYTKEYGDDFYKNLQNNAENGAPSKAFLWPLLISKKQQGSFGYMMELRQNGYRDFGDFLLAKTRFASISAMINAALQICEGFSQLHRNGYSYQDINDGNFFIDPQSGDVLICDNDNVSAQGHNLGIMGKARYMAPEIVGGETPCKYSDFYSLGVILFMLFYGNHPLEGRRVLNYPCMTEEAERKYFGSDALFIFDTNNRENEPVRGVHTNVIARWPLFTEPLRIAFTEAFSQKSMKNPTHRKIISKWEPVFTEMRNRLIICEHCQKETFIDLDKKSNCIQCGQPLILRYKLKTQHNGTIALSGKKSVYLGKAQTQTAQVRVNKKDPSLWALQNLSSVSWSVETASGKLKEIPANDIMPIKPGLKITFSQHEKGEIL